MPIYEYACRACGTRFEELRSMSDRLEAPPCAACGSERTALAMSVPGMVGATAGDGALDACGLGDGSCCGGFCGEPE